MNRLYAIESTPTLTGAKADHRLAVAASEVEGVARELAAAMRSARAARRRGRGRVRRRSPAGWIAAIAKDLQAHKGRSVVVVPATSRPTACTRRRQAINDALGNTGTTVTYGASVEAVPASGQPRSRSSRRPSTPGRSSCS